MIKSICDTLTTCKVPQLLQVRHIEGRTCLDRLLVEMPCNSLIFIVSGWWRHWTTLHSHWQQCSTMEVNKCCMSMLGFCFACNVKHLSAPLQLILGGRYSKNPRKTHKKMTFPARRRPKVWAVIFRCGVSKSLPALYSSMLQNFQKSNATNKPIFDITQIVSWDFTVTPPS